MPEGNYQGRRQEVVFTSKEERSSWLDDAQKIGLPFSKYIYEMARRGREKETSRPKEMANELAELREEVDSLRRKLKDSEKLRQIAEGDLLKARYSPVLQPGESEYSEELVEILQRGGVHQGHDLLRKLGIATGDVQAVQIVHQHLRLFKAMGLVQEEARGWRWIG